MGEKRGGWVKLWRSQFNHWVSEKRPWCDGYAWSYTYSRANHKDGLVNFRNQYIRLKRGEFITSKRKLQGTFGWSRNRLNSFLAALKADNMITYRTTNRYLRIHVLNYEKYQGTAESEDTQNDRLTADRLQTDCKQTTTNKNVKNLKETEGEKKKEEASASLSLPASPGKEENPLPRDESVANETAMVQMFQRIFIGSPDRRKGEKIRDAMRSLVHDGYDDTDILNEMQEIAEVEGTALWVADLAKLIRKRCRSKREREREARVALQNKEASERLERQMEKIDAFSQAAKKMPKERQLEYARRSEEIWKSKAPTAEKMTAFRELGEEFGVIGKRD